MRNNRKYMLAAAAAALAAAGVYGVAQAAAPAAPAAAAPAAAAPAAGAAGLSDPDVKILLANPQKFIGLNALDQRGCETSDKVIGTTPVAIDGYLYGGCLQKGAEKNLDAVRVLLKATEGTGQFRNVAYGFATTAAVFLVVGDTVPAMRMEGAGTWSGEKVKVRIDWDYRVPGGRLFLTRGTAANAQPEISVFADPRRPVTGRIGHLEQPELFGSGPINGVQLVGWQEKTLGVYTAGNTTISPADMWALTALMPTNVVLAGRDSAAVIKASKAGRNDVLTIPAPRVAAGATMVATLDGEGRITHVELTANGKKYAGDFSNYLSDRGDYEVWMPHQIAFQIDGKSVADWQIDWHHANPYVVFPIPSAVAPK